MSRKLVECKTTGSLGTHSKTSKDFVKKNTFGAMRCTHRNSRAQLLAEGFHSDKRTF